MERIPAPGLHLPAFPAWVPKLFSPIPSKPPIPLRISPQLLHLGAELVALGQQRQDFGALAARVLNQLPFSVLHGCKAAEFGAAKFKLLVEMEAAAWHFVVKPISKLRRCGCGAHGVVRRQGLVF